VALRRRRRRARYAETYAASGGVIYTVVQIGCGAILLIGGIGLMVLALVFGR
jgi:NhaP-type Na+/H+ or K+/H+ antiporter